LKQFVFKKKVKKEEEKRLVEDLVLLIKPIDPRAAVEVVANKQIDWPDDIGTWNSTNQLGKDFITVEFNSPPENEPLKFKWKIVMPKNDTDITADTKRRL
jgi:hypothetical protein